MMKTSIKRLEKQNTTTKSMNDFKTSTHAPSRNELIIIIINIYKVYKVWNGLVVYFELVFVVVVVVVV